MNQKKLLKKMVEMTAEHYNRLIKKIQGLMNVNGNNDNIFIVTMIQQSLVI